MSTMTREIRPGWKMILAPQSRRNARENEGYRDKLLASIRDRLGTAAVRGQALDLCQELFVADGARSEEEDAVLQNLRQLLE